MILYLEHRTHCSYDSGTFIKLQATCTFFCPCMSTPKVLTGISYVYKLADIQREFFRVDARSLIIRNMIHEDIEAVLQIEKVSFSRPWTESMILEELDNDKSITFVTFNDAVSAYLCARKSFDEIELLRIAVLPDLRSKGLGRALLKKLCNDFPDQRILLEVDEKNTAAISLYRSSGFRITGRRKHYYGDSDAFLMDRFL